MKPFSILTVSFTAALFLVACSPFSSSGYEVQDDMGDEQSSSMVRQDGPYLEDMDEDASVVELRVDASSSSLPQLKP